MTKFTRSILHRGLAAAAVCLALATPASASIYTISYTGTVATGLDTTGYFFGDGQAHDLAGMAYRTTYTVNTAFGTTNSTATSIVIGGGSILSNTTPVVSAVLTINGTSTVAFAGEVVGFDSREHVPVTPLDRVMTFVDRVDPGTLYEQALSNSVESSINQFLSLLQLDAAFSYDVVPGDQESGDFRFKTASLDARGQLTVSHVEVSQVVPEPATTALLALSLGVGLGVRSVRRRRAHPTAQAS